MWNNLHLSNEIIFVKIFFFIISRTKYSIRVHLKEIILHTLIYSRIWYFIFYFISSYQIKENASNLLRSIKQWHERMIKIIENGSMRKFFYKLEIIMKRRANLRLYALLFFPSLGFSHILQTISKLRFLLQISFRYPIIYTNINIPIFNSPLFYFP